MVALPMDDAIELPVAARPLSPPFSTTTHTAICGFAAGAKATYQPCGGVCLGSLPCSAVPVFDAICRPGDLPSPPVWISDWSIMSRSLLATSWLIAGPPGASCGLNAEIVDMSVNAVLPRTIMTATTVFLALLALFFLGGHVIRSFSAAMIWGIFVATYSSIFICSPMLIYLGVRADTLDKPEETEPQLIAPKAKAKA